ncbi:MAG: HlyD family efflux transporter periplasmic adaptor subunit [Vicinamibacterales bacterium]
MMDGRTHAWQMDQRLALHNVQAPRSARVLARMLVALLAVTAVALTLTPWQQNIPGSGRVIAFSPEERLQQIEAAVDGRVVAWHVVEGSVVRRGDPIVDLTDNDPEILARLEQEREQVLRTIEQGDSRVGALEDRVAGLTDTLRSAVAAAELREQMAHERVRAAEQGLAAARAAKVTADLNHERQQALAAKGLSSTRSLELAVLDAATRAADVDRAAATLNAARSEAASLKAELLRTRADARTRVDEARASLASGSSDVAKARAELAKLEVRVARQQTQRVTAPVDGTVLRVLARRGGELLKAGAPLAVIVPSSSRDVVELWVDGNDMPMVMPGSPVRLQFEGWPALQFSGWPSIAVGTFGGRVLLVDPADNGKGQFRVLVDSDPTDDAWPSRRFLRQGVRANGWVLLNIVPIGYELWRQFNGFPPVIAPDEPAAAAFDPAITSAGNAGGKDGAK